MTQPERRFRQSSQGLILLCLLSVLLVLFAVALIVIGHPPAGTGLAIAGAFIGIAVAAPILAASRSRLRDVTVGPQGLRLAGFVGLDTVLPWTDIQSVRFVRLNSWRLHAYAIVTVADRRTTLYLPEMPSGEVRRHARTRRVCRRGGHAYGCSAGRVDPGW
jgi:hypothetical protein